MMLEDRVNDSISRHMPVHQRLASVLAMLAISAMVLLPPKPASAEDTEPVFTTYADIAHAGYEDSLITARAFKLAVEALIASPDEQTLNAARAAWIAMREPYQQTEAYRFGNLIVDDWEGKVNAWPLDEGLIDYVAAAYGSESDENPLYVSNVIANAEIKLGGRVIDASEITKGLLAGTLQEAGGVEANVATGYHAIEFLLWGQDLNGTGPGAGSRPASDYDTARCTGGHCDRRIQYLRAATDLLIDDLAWMTEQWGVAGAARTGLLNGDPRVGLTAILTGLGSLSYGELAGQRMKLGLLLHDPEEEHDCFSDNTHNSLFYDALGIANVYTGHYRRVDGSVVSGPSVSDLVKARAPDIDSELRDRMAATQEAMDAIVQRAKTTEAYDQMIGEGNEDGNAAVLAAINALLAQTKSIERAGEALQLTGIAFNDAGN
jgi:putative iron-regulated protein